MPRFLHSIAFKSIAILVVSCVLLASVVSYLGDRAGREIASRGVAAVAENQSSAMAEQLVGPLRFKRFADVAPILDAAGQRTSFLAGALVLTQDGTTVLWPEESLSEQRVAELGALAATALETGVLQRSPDGLQLATPIRKKPDDPAVGAVVTIWTKQPFLTTIERYRRAQVTGAAGALFVLVLISIFAIRSTVATPLKRISTRASAMADGDLASSIPGEGLKSEVGDLAGSLEQLRTNLETAEAATKAAFFESAGFQASSAAQTMCDANFRITTLNDKFLRFVAEFDRDAATDKDQIVGLTISELGIDALRIDELLASEFPLILEFASGDRTFVVSIEAVESDGVRQGYVCEWRDATAQKVREGVLGALEKRPVAARLRRKRRAFVLDRENGRGVRHAKSTIWCHNGRHCVFAGQRGGLVRGRRRKFLLRAIRHFLRRYIACPRGQRQPGPRL